LAGSLSGPSKRRAQHDGIGAGGNGRDNVATLAKATISNDVNIATTGLV
jgi:hypothetical protein